MYKILVTMCSVFNWLFFPLVLALAITDLPVKQWLMVAAVWIFNRISIEIARKFVK